MTEEMLRHPYQAPQTAMEQHIAALVEDLKHGAEPQSDIIRKIEAAMDHAFWLEKKIQLLRQNLTELELATMPSLPSITSCTSGSMRDGSVYALDWEMTLHRWRSYFIPSTFDKDEKMWRRTRRVAFRELIKRVRAEFERTFPAHNPVPQSEYYRRTCKEAT